MVVVIIDELVEGVKPFVKLLIEDVEELLILAIGLGVPSSGGDEKDSQLIEDFLKLMKGLSLLIPLIWEEM